MRNLTITVDEEVLRWAKVSAAKRDTSVSRMVGDLLKEKMQQEEHYELAMQDFLSTSPVSLRKANRAYPTREELHDRKNFR